MNPRGKIVDGEMVQYIDCNCCGVTLKLNESVLIEIHNYEKHIHDFEEMFSYSVKFEKGDFCKECLCKVLVNI